AVNLQNSGLVDSETLARARSFPNLRSSAASVIAKQVEMRRGFYERNGVPVFQGNAAFSAQGMLEIRDDLGGRRALRAGAVIIATGARPYRPDDVDFSHPRVFDSDTILDLPDTPRSISIYGAGV